MKVVSSTRGYLSLRHVRRVGGAGYVPARYLLRTRSPIYYRDSACSSFREFESLFADIVVSRDRRVRSI